MQGGKRPRGEEWRCGRIRSRQMILPEKLKNVIDCALSCGWHECDDRYYVRRERQMDVQNNDLLLFTLEGEGVAVLGGEEYRLTRNTVMILPRGENHAYYVPKGGKWEFYWMHMEGPNCDALLQYIIREYGVCLSVNCREEITNYFELILEAEHRYYEYEFFSAQLIVKLLFAIVNGVTAGEKESQHRKALVIKVIDYIEAHARAELRLSDISAMLYLSMEHIIRVFREETGMTPYQYFKQYRLRKACAYLEERDMSISEIAALIGYRSVSSFIAQFKAYYGITPGMYRRFCVAKAPEDKETDGGRIP